jgi:hypothetical protein
MATRKQIIEAIEAVSDSGKTNMIDMPAVAYWAAQMKHYAAAVWLADRANSAAYGAFVLTGNPESFPE